MIARVLNGVVVWALVALAVALAAYVTVVGAPRAAPRGSRVDAVRVDRRPARHHRPVRWVVFVAEKQQAARLGAQLRAARHRIRQLERARHVQAHDSVGVWRTKQIAAAEAIGREALAAGIPDPWPNCADPIRDGAASWDVTVACENGGSWLDSPGFYRCGLQFDPMWERRFGELCPP